MSSIIDFSAALKAAITAGEAIEGTAVKVITADNGATIGGAVVKNVTGGNGSGATIYHLTDAAIEGGQVTSTTATTTGAALFSVSLPTFFAAVAPTLGIVAGVGLYEVVSGDTDFHNRLFEALKQEGKTINGKIIGYFNGDNIGFDSGTIETLKNLLLQYNAFKNTQSTDNMTYDGVTYEPVPYVNYTSMHYRQRGFDNDVTINAYTPGGYMTHVSWWCYIRNGICRNVACSKEPFYLEDTLYHSRPGAQRFIYNEKDVYIVVWPIEQAGHVTYQCGPIYNIPANGNETVVSYIVLYGDETPNPNLQEGASFPYSIDINFPDLYPDWLPWEFPIPTPQIELPNIYPAKYPGTDPDPYPSQTPAQHPLPENVPDTYPYIIPDLPLPAPNPVSVPDAPPVPDPDPQPDPDPIKPTPNEPVDPDPIDPNPDPTPTPIIPPIVLPNTVDSNKLFTVYNPSQSQLDSLGGYLWDDSLMEIIKKIWQNPLDGIISLIQVYVTPVTEGSHNIILGYLDSGVSAPIVGSQFVTVDCGSITLNETKNNATDYSPYTSLSLYLPFIGIVELDVNECMKGTINVTYKVDVYTGTCLALVKITRTEDLPNGGILYTYNGNCSQQLPLTSGDATGVLTGLMSAIGSGLAVASGGGLGLVAGANLIGQSLNHEMLHVSHSGNISANAGIMGYKKPYLIISRAHGYDANAYNSFYGYPANKNINLGNTTGFIRVKECHLQTSATSMEREEIERYLKSGVIL